MAYRGGAIGYSRSGGRAPLPSAPLPRPRLRRRRCRSGRPARRAACPTRTRFANITGPSSEESGASHRFRFALYVTPSEFRISDISQRGSPPFAPPVGFGCLPSAHSRTKQRGSRCTPAAKEPLATMSLHEHDPTHAYLPFEAVSERNHSETWAGCIVSLTTPTRSSLNAARSVWLRSLAEKASRVFLASYFLL